MLTLINDNNKKAHATFILQNYKVLKEYSTISEALEESIHNTKSIHTTDKELEKILTAAIKKRRRSSSKD